MADYGKITFYKLIKFMQADIGIALMPFLYKLANRYKQFYPTKLNKKI